MTGRKVQRQRIWRAMIKRAVMAPKGKAGIRAAALRAWVRKQLREDVRGAQ